MKRFLYLFLCLMITLFLFVACDEETPPPQEPGGDQTPTVEQPIAPADLETVRKTGNFKTICFSEEKSNLTLQLKLPQEWTQARAKGVFAYEESGAAVATISKGKPADAGMTGAKTVVFDGVRVEFLTGMLTRDAVTEPYYWIVFSYDEGAVKRTTTLEVKQSAMDAVLVKWCEQPELLMIQGYNDIPTITLEEESNRDEIVFLGNSFLYSNFSNLKTILQTMLDQGEKDLTVQCAAYGYATVTKYATDESGSYPAIRSDIENGRFSVVFLCGLYSAEDVDNVQIIKNLCDASNTKLVLLPAHNEGKALIQEAQKEYPDVPCLNWKNEIDTLIENGVTQSYFVNDDAHGHSTSLAGYVGAHMIYRSLYGAVPPDLPAGSAIEQSTVNSLLKEYVKKGIRRMDEDEIKWFN